MTSKRKLKKQIKKLQGELIDVLEKLKDSNVRKIELANKLIEMTAFSKFLNDKILEIKPDHSLKMFG